MELVPPADLGFSGTVKYHRLEHAATIAMLQAKGYVIAPKVDAA